MADVKKTVSNASIITSEHVCFDIAGNDYRMIEAIDFMRQMVFVKFLGTHKQDKVDATTGSDF